MAGSAVHRSRRARRWRTAARISRATVVSCAVLLALLGAVMSSPAVTLVWAPGIGIFAAIVAASVSSDGAAARRAAWTAGTGAAAAVPFFSGLGLLGPGGAFVVPVLVVLGSLWVLESAADDRACDMGDVAAARRDLTVLRRALPEVSVDALVREWRYTTDRLRPEVHPDVRAVAAELRSLLIDELTRRDPAGVERWLRAGGGDPGDHLAGGAEPAG
jgi:hypothetical protein